LISCSGSGAKIATNVPTIMLPDPPAYLRPVGAVEATLGEDPVLSGKRYRNAWLQCNARITNGVADWKAMQSFYAKPVSTKH
jgi:hypothetical protein